MCAAWPLWRGRWEASELAPLQETVTGTSRYGGAGDLTERFPVKPEQSMGERNRKKTGRNRACERRIELPLWQSMVSADYFFSGSLERTRRVLKAHGVATIGSCLVPVRRISQ